jgi:ribosomal protein S18 acetylase RimI-like enzyme
VPATVSIVTSVAVTIRQMSSDEFERWLPQMREDYAQGIAEDGGVPVETARAKAAEEIEGLFPDGAPSPVQSVFVLEADGTPVGELWVAERDELLHRDALWVFYVHVDERYRGRGYGREAMLLAEGEARRRGLAGVALNVFGGNEIARNLYRSLGFDEQAVTMSKAL